MDEEYEPYEPDFDAAWRLVMADIEDALKAAGFRDRMEELMERTECIPCVVVSPEAEGSDEKCRLVLLPQWPAQEQSA